MTIVDGRKISLDILQKVKAEIAELPFVPVFCDILVGDDPSSVQYVKMKMKAAVVASAGENYKIKELNLVEPKETDVLVKIVK